MCGTHFLNFYFWSESGKASGYFKFSSLLLVCAFLLAPRFSEAAILSVEPITGTFSVDGTFNASIYLDTEGKSINLFDVYLKYPPDKLQIVSPTIGKSIATIWTSPPSVDNKNGAMHLQGGIPKGIITSDGLITTVTFRVRKVGQAVVKFQDNSKVLLSDGKGTDVLRNTINSIYTFHLPPPAGPYVVSETHPDQTKWYRSGSVLFTWPHDPEVSGYSYLLSDNQTESPDSISEGTRTSVSYNNVKSGTHYFHIKARRGDIWGGTTHFAFNVDTSSPAGFTVEVLPNSETLSRNLVINFFSSDNDSGIDHYEYKLIRLDDPKAANASAIEERFFVEATSPVAITALEPGAYDFIVRAYDKSGNFSDETARITIGSSFFRLITDQGLYVWKGAYIPWSIIFGIAVLMLFMLALRGYMSRKWHLAIAAQKASGEMTSEVSHMMDELKKYKDKYGNMVIIICFVGVTSFLMANSVSADTSAYPQLVSLAPSEISNDEVLYMTGRTKNAHETVKVHIKNSLTNEIISSDVESDNKGNWFYSHPGFLEAGFYSLWAEAEFNGKKSASTKEFEVNVLPAAIQLGTYRLSNEAAYLYALLSIMLSAGALLAYNIIHVTQGRKKQKLMLQHAKQAEASIKRGFAVLKRDIEAELKLLRRNRGGELSVEERQREAELVSDFEWIEKFVGKEIWELESGKRDLV